MSFRILNHDMNNNKFEILDILVWLESTELQHSKTFFQIENPLNIKEVMSPNMFWDPAPS